MLTKFQKRKIKKPNFHKTPWQKHDMVALYENYTGNILKRSGRAWVGKCPFHSDDKPSFAIYEDTDSYYCFGCGVSGNSSWFKRELTRLKIQL